MTAEWTMWLADGVVLAGLACLTVAVIGLIRIPNAYMKVHASGGGVVVGAALILLAALTSWDVSIISRAILVGSFLLLTAPVAAHALAHLEALLRNDVSAADCEE